MQWDGVRRFEKLAKDICPDRSGVADIALRIFFIQACAAADHAETAAANDEAVEAHFESVLVLVGDQGIGKTKGLKNLLPPKLRKYYNEGAVLNLSDKDSTLQVVGFWVVEMGEVDATFRTSDISRHKAFLSRSVDIIRAPYARKASSHSRRTVFVGTVNDESFLADETGNRRYLPVSVTEFKVDWPDAEIDQLWAEAWARYVGGEKWWARKEEEVLLERNAEKFRSRSEVEERIESHFAWDAGVDFEATRQTASEIYHAAMTDNSRMPLQKDLKTVGQVMKRCWKATGRTETIEGELAVKDDKGAYVWLNSKSGKNRGWILPPLRQDAACHALAIALKKQEDGE